MESTPVFSFGIIADIQYCDAPPAYGRYFRASLKKLEEAIITFQEQSVNFIIDLGDLIDRKMESFNPVLQRYAQSHLLVYYTPGNHDFSVDESDKKQVLGKMGLSSGYYSLARDGFRFVILNGSEISTFAHPTGSDAYLAGCQMLENMQARQALQAYDWNGAVGQAQLVWLEEILSQAAAVGEKVIICCHYPVFPSQRHCLWNASELMDVMDRYTSVVAYLNGHQHQGGFEKRKHISYLNFKGMVETEESNAYAIVRVYPDRLEIVGYGREVSRVIDFSHLNM